MLECCLALCICTVELPWLADGGLPPAQQKLRLYQSLTLLSVASNITHPPHKGSKWWGVQCLRLNISDKMLRELTGEDQQPEGGKAWEKATGQPDQA